MTISITASSCSYTANGSLQTFDVKDGSDGIYFATAAELYVTVTVAGVTTVQVLNTHYTVAGAGSAAGSITFLTAPPNGATVYIERQTPRTQTLDLVDGGSWSPTNVESTFDKIVRMIQDVGNHVDAGIDADAAADAAAASASAAATSASNAATSASNASSSASAAATSAALAAAAAVSSSLTFKWSTDTAATDPGSTYVKGNNAALGSITALYMSETSLEGAIGGALTALFASTNGVKATVALFKAAAKTNFLIVDVTVHVDSGAYRTLTATVTASAGSFAADDTLVVGIVRAGDQGSGAVASFNGRTGAVTLTSADVGAVLDGDKGDITVSASGATWTIDNDAVSTAKIAADAVTYAKIQNVSATSRILGRKTAAAGDTEECTLSEVLDFIGSAAQGDILYRGASAWERLAAGTSGQFLKTNGAGANPSWATGGTDRRRSYAEYTTNANISTALPYDDTVPTSTEGAQILAATITPSTTSKRVRIGVYISMGELAAAACSTDRVAAAIFRGSTCIGVFSLVNTTTVSAFFPGISHEIEDAPATTSSVTYSVRVGPNSGTSVMRLNGNASQRFFGGAAKCTLIVEEIEP